MNKKSFAKRILAAALSLIMVLGLLPMTAFAYPGDDGHTLTANDPGQYDMDGRPLLVFVTPDGGAVSRISGGNSDSTQQFTATANNGWVFKAWRTYYDGITSNADNPNHTWDSEWCFSQPGNSEVKPDLNYKTIQVNREWDAAGTFYLYAIFNPVITVQIDEGVFAYYFTQLYTNGKDTHGASGDASGQFSNVYYGRGLKFSFGIKDNFVPVRVSVNGEGTTFDNLANNYLWLTGPVTVEVTTRLKNSIVRFDANGGEGAMATQTFEHSVAQALTANSFTKTGYTFAGWNTKADGTGTVYADKQSVTFTPANDGDSITLYAQWTQCTDHNWENGVCTKCGAVCPHSMIYSTSDNRIVETCTAGCGHTATADIVRDENVSTVYSGSAIEALKVSYSDNWQSGELVITYSNNIKVGVAEGSVTIGGKTASKTFAITEATMSGVSAQGYSGVYDGQAHSIAVNAPAGATVSYKAGNGTYNTEAPTFKDAGTYTVSYKVSMANYSDVEGTAEVKIDTVPLTVTANNKTIIYGDAPANGGVSYSGFVANENADVLGGTLGYDYNYTQYGDVGNYDILPNGLTSNNYEITFTKGTLTVLQKEIGIAWSNTALIYNGTAQKPTATAAGTANGDPLVLTVDGAETNASDTAYTATVTGIGGEKAGNYKLPASVTTEFTIGRATPDLGTVSAAGVVTDTTKPEDVVLVRTNETVAGTLRIVKVGSDFMQANKSDYDWEFVPVDMENYNAAYGYVQIDVLDTVAPNGAIKVDTNEWKQIINDITFGLFFKETQEVTITAADNENGSGIKDILYVVSDQKLSDDDLATAEWKSYTESFDIEPNGKFVVYAKITDNDGNTLYINSDGIVLDNIAPSLEGIENGKTYYGDLTVIKSDEQFYDIKTVTLDGEEMGFAEGTYGLIPADNAEHIVVVEDHAGNKTAYTVTVYKNYTVTFKADSNTVDTQTVDYGKDATVPAVPAKDGYVGKWDSDGKNITNDTTISVVYTEIPAVKPDEVKPEDKSDLEDAKAKLEEMLEDDSYTDDDKKDIQDAIDDIDDALEVIGNAEKVEELIGKLPENITKNDEAAIKAADDALGALSDREKSLVDEDAKKALDDAKAALAELNKPADTAPPNTGDSSLWLWAALLFVSGTGIFGITLYDCKRKAASKR